jgi:hypothetical protein
MLQWFGPRSIPKGWCSIILFRMFPCNEISRLDACFLSHVSELLNVHELYLGAQSVGSSFTGSLIVFFINTLIAVISDIMMTDLKDSCFVEICGTFMNYLSVSAFIIQYRY